MKNKLSYLGFLGFIGLIGLYWGSFIHSVFLVFFFFFAYKNVIPDELFKENIKLAALRAFLVNMIFSVIIVMLNTVISNYYQYTELNMKTMLTNTVLFALNFALSILIFVFTLIYYNHREKKALE